MMAITREQWEEREREEAARVEASAQRGESYGFRDGAGRWHCAVSCPERPRCLDVANAARCPLFRMYQRKAAGQDVRISGSD